MQVVSDNHEAFDAPFSNVTDFVLERISLKLSFCFTVRQIIITRNNNFVLTMWHTISNSIQK